MRVNTVRLIAMLTMLVITSTSAAQNHFRIETIAGQIRPDNTGPSNTFLQSPRGLAFDGSGNLHIAELKGRIVRKISAGVITTVAGPGFAAHGPTGAATDTSLSAPSAVAFDSAGD